MEEAIKAFIQAQPEQVITYEKFMETALYQPGAGYYMTERSKVGKEGDFYTSPHVHPVFGRVFASVFFDWIQKQHLPPVICEFGGGDGRFAEAVLKEWERLSESSDLQVTYIIVESSPYQREKQRERLPVGKQVIQYESFEHLQSEYPCFHGIVFSNELLDAFPVRVAEVLDQKLFEILVAVDNIGELVEIKKPCTDAKILAWLDDYGFPVKEGQRIEIPLVMTAWIQKIANWLGRGVVFTVDYGYTMEEWQAQERREGSLRGYYKHKMMTNALMNPGRMDLTSHIHLDAVKQIGEDNGLNHLYTLSQSKFLLKERILDYLIEHEDPDPFSEASKQNRAIRSLVMDGAISSYFHVIVQGKKLNSYSIGKDDE